MPVIIDGDFKLTESTAILRYVVGKYRVDDSWYPEDPKERARIDEYLAWTYNNIRMRIAQSFFAKFRNPLLYGKKSSPENVSIFFEDDGQGFDD